MSEHVLTNITIKPQKNEENKEKIVCKQNQVF